MWILVFRLQMATVLSPLGEDKDSLSAVIVIDVAARFVSHISSAQRYMPGPLLQVCRLMGSDEPLLAQKVLALSSLR